MIEIRVSSLRLAIIPFIFGIIFFLFITIQNGLMPMAGVFSIVAPSAEWFVFDQWFQHVSYGFNENGVVSPGGELKWEDMNLKTIRRNGVALTIHSDTLIKNGWLALPSPWLCINRDEVADYIASHGGREHPLYRCFTSRK